MRIARSFITRFHVNFYWLIFKDFSHSYSSKLLILFSSFSVVFLTKAHNCRHYSSIYLVSFSDLSWSISIFCDFLWPHFVIFILFLFRFLITCFDSSHMIAAYDLTKTLYDRFKVQTIFHILNFLIQTDKFELNKDMHILDHN